MPQNLLAEISPYEESSKRTEAEFSAGTLSGGPILWKNNAYWTDRFPATGARRSPSAAGFPMPRRDQDHGTCRLQAGWMSLGEVESPSTFIQMECTPRLVVLPYTTHAIPGSPGESIVIVSLSDTVKPVSR